MEKEIPFVDLLTAKTAHKGKPVNSCIGIQGAAFCLCSRTLCRQLNASLQSPVARKKMDNQRSMAIKVIEVVDGLFSLCYVNRRVRCMYPISGHSIRHTLSSDLRTPIHLRGWHWA